MKRIDRDTSQKRKIEMSKDEETISHLYHYATDWLAKVSVQSDDIIAAVRKRLKAEGERSKGEDRIALQVMANAILPYIQDYKEGKSK